MELLTQILFGVVLMLLLGWLACCFVMTVAVPRLRQPHRRQPAAQARDAMSPVFLNRLMGAPHETHA